MQRGIANMDTVVTSPRMAEFYTRASIAHDILLTGSVICHPVLSEAEQKDISTILEILDKYTEFTTAEA